jgi:hypothetical protein
VFDRIMDHANAELKAMIEEGAITADEWARMALNVWPRRRAELTAPFADDGRFESLVLKESETCAAAAFSDRLTRGLKRRFAAEPAPLHSLVQIVVVAKAQA